MLWSRFIAVAAAVLLASSAAAQEPAPAPATVPDLGALTAPAPAPALATAPGTADSAQPAELPSVFTRWWFWTAAGALVVGAIVLGVALQPRDPGCPSGTICL